MKLGWIVLGLALLGGQLWSAPQPSGERIDYDYQLPQTSPNGKYVIEFAETRSHVMLYRWVQLQPRRVLLDIRSGYQADPDNLEWARDLTKGALIFWSKDNRYVAIDEAVNHGSGKTVVAFLATPDRAELIPIPEASIRAATGEQWRRSRFGFRRWSDNGVVHLSLNGFALANKKDVSETPELKRVGYAITLQRVGRLFRLRKVEVLWG